MLSFAVTRNQNHHGGHQEENAVHESGEGQPDGPVRRLRAGWRPRLTGEAGNIFKIFLLFRAAAMPN